MVRVKKNIAVSDTGFLFDPSTGESYTLNETGKEIFNLMKEGMSVENIAKRITKEYDIDPISFEKYFQDFTEMLSQYSLLEHEEEV